jgi:hypothetical protein
MLLYECGRCKFRSPDSAFLCHTCGAKLQKSEPVQEVLYRLQDRHKVTAGDLLFSLFDFVGSCLSKTWEALVAGMRPHHDDFKIPAEKPQLH